MQNVATGKIVACKELIILCNKLLSDIEKSKEEDYLFYFDVNKSMAIDGFLSTLRFTEGRKVGKPITLANFQDFIIKMVFCWREKENSNITRFNDVLIFLPRKQGKSFICAMLGILGVMLESNAEVLNGAVALSQAKIIVTQAQRLIQSNPKLAKQFKIYKSHIEFVGSIFKPVSSNVLDGSNASIIMLDESERVDKSLMESMTSGFAQRESYQSYYLSTEYATQEKTGWFDELKDIGLKVNEGVLENERILTIVYKLDSAEEVGEREMWIKSNPIISEIGDTFLYEQYLKALESPSAMKNLLIKNHNLAQATTSDDAYVDMDKWKTCEVKKIDWKGIRVDVGIDLSKTMDLTAVSFTGIDSNGNVLVNSHGFLPEETLNKRQEMTDYRLMESLGHCSINEGAIIDYDFVIEYICNIEKKFGCVINSIQFDPFNAIHMMSTLSKKDFNCVEVRQNRMTLTIPTKTFREKVYTGMVQYEKNDLLAWCVSNAVESEDNNGNIALDKKKSKNRIDLIASVIFAYVETMKTKIVFDIDDYGIY